MSVPPGRVKDDMYVEKRDVSFKSLFYNIKALIFQKDALVSFFPVRRNWMFVYFTLK